MGLGWDLPDVGIVEFCPRQQITPFSSLCLEQHAFFRDHGQLPYAGAIADQPAKLMEAFQLIDAFSVKYRTKPGDK